MAVLTGCGPPRSRSAVHSVRWDGAPSTLKVIEGLMTPVWMSEVQISGGSGLRDRLAEAREPALCGHGCPLSDGASGSREDLVAGRGGATPSMAKPSHPFSAIASHAARWGPTKSRLGMTTRGLPGT